MTGSGRRVARGCVAAFAVAMVASAGLPATGSAATPLLRACVPGISGNSMSLDPAVIDGWYDVSGGGGGTKVTSIQDWRTVPGDVLEFRASVTLRAHGAPVRGTLSVDGAGLTGDADLMSMLTLTQEPEPAGTTVTEADDGRVIPVRAKLVYDVNTSGRFSQAQSVNLSGVKIRFTADTENGSGTGGDDCSGSGSGTGQGGNTGDGGGGQLPGRDVGNRVPISQVPSGPISLPR